MAQLSEPTVKFHPESGGHIHFEYDTENYYAVATHGTSVPLYDEELVFVPDEKCRCSDPNCKGPERHFVSEDVIPVKVKPDWHFTDTQDYAKRFTCFVSVYLYDKEKVHAFWPDGYRLALAILDERNDVYSVQSFI